MADVESKLEELKENASANMEAIEARYEARREAGDTTHGFGANAAPFDPR